MFLFLWWLLYNPLSPSLFASGSFDDTGIRADMAWRKTVNDNRLTSFTVQINTIAWPLQCVWLHLTHVKSVDKMVTNTNASTPRDKKIPVRTNLLVDFSSPSPDHRGLQRISVKGLMRTRTNSCSIKRTPLKLISVLLCQSLVRFYSLALVLRTFWHAPSTAKVEWVHSQAPVKTILK